MKEVSYIIYRELEVEENYSFNFKILNSTVFTTKDINSLISSEKNTSKKYLCINIKIEIQGFETLNDCAAYARPQLLIILGILSLFTFSLFSVFDFTGRIIGVKEKHQLKTNSFIINGKSYFKDLKKLQRFINDAEETDTKLLYSLLDRWRKAFFLEEESEDNMLHDDEIILSYFHILELISNHYYKKQKNIAESKINSFVEDFIKNIYLLPENLFEDTSKAKKKLIESILISEVSVASKIYFTLKELNLLSPRVKNFISNLIKDRNLVAHGRQAFQNNIIYPLPPFFPLIKNSNYTHEMLRILTGRTIALFFNSNINNDKWPYFLENIAPTLDEVNIFIRNEEYNKISLDDFLKGLNNDITPNTIFYYLLEKKIKPNVALKIFDIILNNNTLNEDQITTLVSPIALLSDYATAELKEKCIEIILCSSENAWLPQSNFRDLLYFFQNLGFKATTLKELLISKKIR